MTAPRRYFQKSIEDLEAIFGSNLNDRGILARLSSELKHRKSIRAQQLKDRTEERLQELDHQAEPGISPGTGAKAHEGEPRPKDSSQARHPRDEVAAGGCRRIDREADEGNQANQSRPNADGAGDDEPPDDRRQPETLTRIARPGVAGKPNAYVPRLKSDLTIDLPAGTTRARRYVQALAALISEMRKAGKGNQRYALENGKLIDAQNGQPIYAFPFPDRADLFEDTSVEIEADGRRRSGQLVSLAGGKLLIALDEHLGPVIHRCVLLIDNTALIEMLKERLYLADQGKIDVSLALANSVVDQHVEPPLAQPVPVVGVEGLNPDQRRSLETMLKRAVSYLWGPPGTGKTQTLSAAVKTLFEAEKRILICSNTNQAVDQLLLAGC